MTKETVTDVGEAIIDLRCFAMKNPEAEITVDIFPETYFVKIGISDGKTRRNDASTSDGVRLSSCIYSAIQGFERMEDEYAQRVNQPCAKCADVESL